MSDDAGPTTPHPGRYRSAALRRLESPDRLDLAAAVTDAKGWVVIVAALVAALTLVVWSVVGRIPQSVTVSGMLVRAGAETTAHAPTGGVVSTSAVGPGDTVQTGDPLVTLVGDDGSAVQVESPARGTVQEVAVRPGATVDAGAVVASILDTRATGHLRAVTYVEAPTAAELSGAQDVTVLPATVDPTVHGSLEGDVAFVATLPASHASMVATLQSEALADEFHAAAAGVPYLVVVEFDDPPAWTNGDAPPGLLVDATLAEVSGVVSRDRPITLLFGN